MIDRLKDRIGYVAHAAWAVLAVIVALILIFTRGGHPSPIVFVPLVLIIWFVGHFVILGIQWLAGKGRRLDNGTGHESSSWPIGLWFALVGTGIPALTGIFQLLMTAWERRLYPYHYFDLWAMMLAVWLVHGACFAGLLLRQRWSRFLSAMLAFGWSILLALQIAEHLPPTARSDTTGLLLAFGMMALLLLFGLYLVASRKVKTLLTR